MKKLKQLIKSIVENCSIFLNKRAELKVWQKCDRLGNSYWLVFDPITGLSYSFCSEQEIKIWIEQRYHSHVR